MGFDPMAFSAPTPITYAEKSIAELSADQIFAWRDAGIVVLAGSFISTYAPSNLAMGNDIGSHIWKILFNPTVLKRASWPVWLEHDFRQLPFEVLTERYPDAFGIKKAAQRAFGTANYNPVHKLLADELQSGAIRGIMTTNYDMCLDAALQHTQGLVTVWDKESWELNRRAITEKVKPYWKIHGSAHAADSLILSLRGEARMEDWKQKLLTDFVRDKTLLVIGYGGRDFEICPELAYTVHPRYTVWLDRTAHITPNAKRVLKQQRGTLVLGDLKELLEKLFHFDPNGLTRNATALDLPIDPDLIPEWRVRLLDWMGCGPLVLRELDGLHDPRLRVALSASACGHVGRYKDGVDIIETEVSNTALSRRDQLRLRLSAASSWFIYGAHLKGWRRMKSIEKHVAVEGFSDLRVPLTECKMMMLMRFRQLARIGHIPFAARAIVRAAKKSYDGTRKALEAEGDFGGSQALRLNAQRIGLLASEEMALAPIEGYASLGALDLPRFSLPKIIETHRLN